MKLRKFDWQLLSCCVCVCLMAGTALAQQAGLDPDFGKNGVVSFKYGAKNTEAGGFCVQKDGKLLFGGTADNDMIVIRCLPTGEPDPSFGNGGLASFDSGGTDTLSAMGLCVDGSIVVGGTLRPAGQTSERIALVRFDKNGTIDAGYGENGVVSADLGPRSKIDSIVPLSDGSVLISGRAASLKRAMIARYDRRGIPDASFGSNGAVYSDEENSEYTSLTLQADGAIIACGYTADDQSNYNALAARYTPGGARDATFADSGTLEIDLGSKGDRFNKAIELRNRSILFVGESIKAGNKNRTVTLFQTLGNGAPDEEFGDDGKKLLDTGDLGSMGTDAIVLEDGSLLIAGQYGNNKRPEKHDILLARFRSDGAMQESFGVNGVLSTDLGADEKVCAVSSLGGGKVLVAGSSGKYGWSSNNLKMILVRYAEVVQPDELPQRDRDLDGTFGHHGFVRTDFSGDDKPNDMAVFPDGSFIVLGSSVNEKTNASGVVMAKYLPSGALDTSFGRQGLSRVDPGYQAYGYKIAPLADGKYYVGGAVDDRPALFRFEANGTLDKSFGQSGASIVQTKHKCWGRAMALQEDGKMLLGGRMEIGRFDHRVVLCRYLSSGELDPSFGSDGVVVTNLDGRKTDVYSLAVRDDGTIFAAGHGSTKNNKDMDIFVACYTPDGALDANFGDGGTLLLDQGGLEYVRSVALTNDGALLLGGSGGPEGKMMLVCLDEGGKLRPSYGNGGRQFLSVKGGSSERYYGRSLSLFPDGRALLVGDNNGKIAALCVQPDGSLDTTFGRGGSVYTDLGSWSGALAGALAPDGKVLVSGFSRKDFFTARYTGPASFRTPSAKDAAGGQVEFVKPFTKVEDKTLTRSIVREMRERKLVLKGEPECVSARINLTPTASSDRITLPLFPSRFPSKKGMSLVAFAVTDDGQVHPSFEGKTAVFGKDILDKSVINGGAARSLQLVLAQGLFVPEASTPSDPAPSPGYDKPKQPAPDLKPSPDPSPEPGPNPGPEKPSDPANPPSPDAKKPATSDSGCSLGAPSGSLLSLMLPLLLLALAHGCVGRQGRRR